MKQYNHLTNCKDKLNIVFFCFCFLFIFNVTAWGQSYEDDLFEKLMEQDSSYINALVLYPDSIRDAIFVASMYPEILVKVDEMSDKTRKRFKTLISPYNQETQSQIWEISRYSKLVDELTQNGELSKKEIDYVTFGYPENIQQAAQKIGTKQYAVLSEIAQINYAYNHAFESLLSSYPKNVQKAYFILLNFPEVMEILSDNLRITILVGDSYKNNPKKVKQQADSIHLEIARENAEELAEWQLSFQEDTLAMQELISSANEYAKEKDYDESDYTSPSNTSIVIHQYPYPYWFGYPSWYSYSYWYPKPWWYDWGFYYGSYGEVIFISLPSYHFTYWYFHNHHHHYHHPHLTNRYIGHYYGHRTSITGMNRAINNWKNENRLILREDWISSETGRIARVREFGKLEMDRERYNGLNPGNNESKEQYYRLNANKYPGLKPFKVDKPNISVRPIKKVPNEYYTPKPQKTKPKNPPGKKPLNQGFPYSKPKQPAYPSIDHNKARDHHQENWKKPRKNKPVKPRVTPSKKPKPVVRPVAKPKPITPIKKRKH